ncbi:MAG TPA: sigma 54-interacting transcriptional regulator [Polyangiales bacterium]|nr:sigma 54-interacting transcriptional regulator [Polyangiales bacterium]
MTDRASEPNDADKTETERSLRERVPSEQRPAILWTFPKYGLVTAPERRCVIGRAENCGAQLEGSKISREHAEISPVGSAFGIRDLGSRNGVWVNGQRVEATALMDGDVVRLGEWIGVVVPGLTESVQFSEIAPGLLGGPRLAAVLAPARKLIEKSIPLVIHGATGTGKERVARALHGWSGRSGEYVGVNCAAIPTDLAEAELFGHSKGAFTGAERARLGFFRQADRGTLLLDEFLELAPRAQAKLLRVLEESEVQPIGDSRAYPIDVLLLAATQQPLAAVVDAGQMRNDLVARLGVYTLVLPRLAERREDIAPLFMHFARDPQSGRVPDIDPELIEWLCLQPWTQNVRELEWLARAMMALHDEKPCLMVDHLPPQYQSSAGSQSAVTIPSPALPPVEDSELFQRLKSALDENGGVILRAAEALGITRQKAYRILDKQGFNLEGLRRRR